MASELNCTQFTEPWPNPGTPGADDITMTWLINTVVKKYSLAGIVFLHMTVDYLTVVLHASSLFLAVSLAFCRVMSLKITNKNRSQWQSPKYAVRMALGLCSPIVVSASSVLFMNSVQEDEEEGVHLQISDLSLANGCLYMKLILLNGGIYLKVMLDSQIF
ncbi:hypothetical protein L3Y34_008617 [Caenorhabditis briggsae]|uniref:Uncharacterized protein n=1 Tax=Caenorhabditis briggsae TaxID=6238 RepID=A0AAE9D0V5_CAEBR|nr:hypothetical protein L3Y34_008617 [Caenorhabditis briggsae]